MMLSVYKRSQGHTLPPQAYLNRGNEGSLPQAGQGLAWGWGWGGSVDLSCPQAVSIM